MLKLKKLSETMGIKVYTNDGDFFGLVEEIEIVSNRVYGWKIKPTKESYLYRSLGGAKGVIVPHKLVSAIGDIMVISKTAIPSLKEEETSTETVNNILED